MKPWIPFFMLAVLLTPVSRGLTARLPAPLEPDVHLALAVVYALYGPWPFAGWCGCLIGFQRDLLSLEADGFFTLACGLMTLALASLREFVMIQDVRVSLVLSFAAILGLEMTGWLRSLFVADGGTWGRLDRLGWVMTTSAATAVVAAGLARLLLQGHAWFGLNAPRYRAWGS